MKPVGNAYLAVMLIAGIVLGPSAQGNPLIGVVIIVLSGLVFGRAQGHRPTSTDGVAIL